MGKKAIWRAAIPVVAGTTIALALALGRADDLTPTSARPVSAATLCGEGSAPDYGFTYDLMQDHWTVGWQGYASEEAVNQVDVILDELDAGAVAQTMILILPEAEVGTRVNCAVHFLRYMRLGLPTGERKDNGFVFLIVVEPDGIDVHYGVGLGLPALTAQELTSLNRAAEAAYEPEQNMDQALLTLVQEFDTVARSNYPPLVEPTPVYEETEPTQLPLEPASLWLVCCQLCLIGGLILFMLWAAGTWFRFFPSGFGGSGGGWSGGGGWGRGGGWSGGGGGWSGGGGFGGGRSRGGSGSGRSGRGN